MKNLLRTKRISLQGTEADANTVISSQEDQEQVDEGSAQTGDSGNVVARKFFKAKRRVPANGM